MTYILWVLVGLGILFPFLNFFLGIHPPSISTTDDPSRYDLPFEHVSFPTVDGLTLRGWFIPAPNSSPPEPHAQRHPTIMVGHGYPFDKANILRHGLFLHPYYHLLFFDFRYFGESDGHYTTVGANEIRDVQAALTYLQHREDVDTTKIGALGFSMSAATFIMAQESRLRAIVADSPYASLQEIVRQQFSFLPDILRWPFVQITNLFSKVFLGFDLADVSPQQSVRTLNTPLLLIHGEADSQISPDHSKHIAHNANPDLTSLWIVPGADHGQAHAVEGTRYEQRILQFFQNQFSPDSYPRKRKEEIRPSHL